MRTIWIIGGLLALSACHPYHGPRTRLDIPEAPQAQTGDSPPSARTEPSASVTQRIREDLPPIKPAITKEPVKKGAQEAIADVSGRLRDAFFDYDRADLSNEALSALQYDATLLVPIFADFPHVQVTIEGHCDERGSAEYNLALGDRRAKRAAETLRELGVGAAKLETISYGKERPQCEEAAPACWRRNRRAHLVLQESGGVR